MYSIETALYRQLCFLRDEFDLKGIKAEFEAEGSSFRDLMRLRRLTDKANVPLYLKIGGVEAVRDIKDSLELGVNGIIAPMCESKFGVKKFVDAFKAVYKMYKIHLSVNVETKCAIDSIEEIISESVGFIDNITIGRTDLSGSYFSEDIYPDSDFIFEKIEMVSNLIQKRPITLTVGGSISQNTIMCFESRKNLTDSILKLETRKVMLPSKVMLFQPEAIKQCLKFEELYILSKKEYSDLNIESDLNRLTQLKRRL